MSKEVAIQMIIDGSKLALIVVGAVSTFFAVVKTFPVV